MAITDRKTAAAVALLIEALVPSQSDPPQPEAVLNALLHASAAAAHHPGVLSARTIRRRWRQFAAGQRVAPVKDNVALNLMEANLLLRIAAAHGIPSTASTKTALRLAHAGLVVRAGNQWVLTEHGVRLAHRLDQQRAR